MITSTLWKHDNSQNNCEIGKQIGDKTVPGFKINYKATVRNTVWHWHNYRYIDQWNRSECSEIDLHILDNWILTKEQKQWSAERIVFLFFYWFPFF